jgi:hypothetical protein
MFILFKGGNIGLAILQKNFLLTTAMLSFLSKY